MAFTSKFFALGSTALVAALVVAAPARAQYVENFDALSFDSPYTSTTTPCYGQNLDYHQTCGTGAQTLTSSSGGITLTYSDATPLAMTTSPVAGDPYGWVVRSNLEPDAVTLDPRFNFTNMSGNVFIDFGNDPLNIAVLATPDGLAATDINFNFGLRFPSSCAFGGTACYPQATATSLILTAYNGSNVVGTETIQGVIPSGSEFEEGFIDFSGPAFTSISITTTSYNYGLNSCSTTDLANGTCAVTHVAPVAIAIDNVDVTVPEPTTYALIGVGVLGLAFTRQMRRRTKVKSQAQIVRLETLHAAPPEGALFS